MLFESLAQKTVNDNWDSSMAANRTNYCPHTTGLNVNHGVLHVYCWFQIGKENGPNHL